MRLVDPACRLGRYGDKQVHDRQLFGKSGICLHRVSEHTVQAKFSLTDQAVFVRFELKNLGASLANYFRR